MTFILQRTPFRSSVAVGDSVTGLKNLARQDAGKPVQWRKSKSLGIYYGTIDGWRQVIYSIRTVKRV